jgi:hypothetical protein
MGTRGPEDDLRGEGRAVTVKKGGQTLELRKADGTPLFPTPMG